MDSRPAEQALRLWSAFRVRDWKAFAALLHPDAEIVTVLAQDRTVPGAEWVELLQAATEEGGFDPNPVAFVELDEQRVLLLGAFRPALAHGEADATVFTFADGLLRSAHYYESAAAAERDLRET